MENGEWEMICVRTTSMKDRDARIRNYFTQEIIKVKHPQGICCYAESFYSSTRKEELHDIQQHTNLLILSREICSCDRSTVVINVTRLSVSSLLFFATFRQSVQRRDRENPPFLFPREEVF